MGTARYFASERAVADAIMAPASLVPPMQRAHDFKVSAIASPMERRSPDSGLDSARSSADIRASLKRRGGQTLGIDQEKI